MAYFFIYGFLYNELVLYVWLTVLVLFNTVWLALVPFSLPGNWLMLITTGVFAWWRAEDGVFSGYTLVAAVGLAFLGELIEFFGGMGGARKGGAGLRGSIGAIVGAITGALLGTFIIPIPFLGTLLGSCIGAGLGAWGMELLGGKEMRQSVRLGFGAGLGQFLGTTAKFVIGIAIWLTITIAAFWP